MNGTPYIQSEIKIEIRIFKLLFPSYQNSDTEVEI